MRRRMVVARSARTPPLSIAAAASTSTSTVQRGLATPNPLTANRARTAVPVTAPSAEP